MQLVLERGMVLVQPYHSPVGVTDTSKAGSKHREPKWHFSAQISKALVTAVGMEGRMQVSDWGICTCSIFWGACIQISLSLTGSGNYLFFIVMHLDLDLVHYSLGLPFFGREKTLLYVCTEWCYLMKQREVGSGKMCFNSTSVSWVHEQSLPSAKPLQASIFSTQCPCMLKAPTNASSPALFSFLHML